MNRREELPEEAPLWGQNLIVLQMASLYFWTAFDKSGTPFLNGDRLEAIFNWGHTNRPIEPFLAVPGFAMAASVAVVAVEYFLAVGILVRRLAKFAIPAGLLLHAGFYELLPVSTYSISMMALYLVVIHPDVLHRFLDRIQC